MNLAKLFEAQKKLDEHIEKEHPRQEGEDRLAKKILALKVELGELAQEWRGFKYWSHDQEPRTVLTEIPSYGGIPFFADAKTRNPMLEEYVDCLHFILSIGLELGVPYEMLLGKSQVNETIEDDFINLYHDVLIVHRGSKHRVGKKPMRIYYESLLEDFITLGERLGFTWEQVEQAYMEKNKINHERQEAGY